MVVFKKESKVIALSALAQKPGPRAFQTELLTLPRRGDPLLLVELHGVAHVRCAWVHFVS